MERNKILWTQKKVADKLNIAQTTYSGWENERRQMDYSSLIKGDILIVRI